MIGKSRGDTQGQLVVLETLNLRREIARGELAFALELCGHVMCVLIHSAVIVEHFLHDRNAVESCASVSFSFVSGDYNRDSETERLCCLVIKSTGSGLGHTWV